MSSKIKFTKEQAKQYIFEMREIWEKFLEPDYTAEEQYLKFGNLIFKFWFCQDSPIEDGLEYALKYSIYDAKTNCIIVRDEYDSYKIMANNDYYEQQENNPDFNEDACLLDDKNWYDLSKPYSKWIDENWDKYNLGSDDE